MSTVLDRLTTVVKQSDPATDPKYAAAAGLLSEASTEIQRHAQVVSELAVRVGALLDEPEVSLVKRQFDKQADWCADILERAGGPMNYGAIADQMYAEGYTHSARVKNPDRQLKDSIWVAMNEDARFIKVGRGKWDLAKRHEGE